MPQTRGLMALGLPHSCHMLPRSHTEVVGIIECRENLRSRVAPGSPKGAPWLVQTDEFCQDDYIILKKNILGSGYNGKA